MEQTQFRRSLRLHYSIPKNVLTQKSAKTIPEMGSKTPNNKVKQDTVCDVCDTKFQTIQALRSHQNAKHPDELKKESSPEPRAKATPKNTYSRVSKRLQLKKGQNSEESEDSVVLFYSLEDSDDVEEKKKIGFACPKCSKTFTIYFQAVKHIQKKHCEDSDGNPVSPDSPDIIKPLTIGDSSPAKNSLNLPISKDKETSLEYSNIIYCLGCEQQFKSVVMFNRHASCLHQKDVDSMFFKTSEEFTMWKQMMETQVKVKYLSLKQKTSQRYYHCNYVSPKNEFDKTYLCPSLIDLKELQTGKQIHYSKEHYGHTCPEYHLPESFLQYLTCQKKVKIDKNDLYAKLKEILENVSEEAAKLSYSNLERLYASALKLKSMLNDENDKEVSVINRNMTDDQITDALEGKRSSARLKRKSETVTVDIKKAKLETDESKSKKYEVKTVSKENQESGKPSSPILSPTFNDTYKQFIGSPNSEPKPKIKRKEVVKTKIGQYSPKKKDEDIDKSKPNILRPSKTNTVHKALTYEVREQENDCNILILKI